MRMYGSGSNRVRFLRPGGLSENLRRGLTGYFPMVAGLPDGSEVFVRGTTRTYTDMLDGLVKTAGVGVPAFESRGLVVGKANTNFFQWSESLDSAPWAGAATVTANQALAPDGTLTADLVDNGGGTFPGRYQQYVVNPAGATYTFSIWMRAVTGSHTAKLTVENNAIAELTTITPTVTTTWQRFQVTKAFVGAAAAVRGRYYPCLAGPSTVYAWGGQLEASQVAFSYIKTEAAPATKALDQIAITNDGLLVDGAGSLLLTYAPISASTVSVVNTIVDGPGSGMLYRDGATIKSDDGTSVVSLATTWSAGQRVYLVLTWGANGRTIYRLDTGTAATGLYDGSFALGAAVNFYQGASAPNGNIGRVAMWDRELSAQEVSDMRVSCL